MFATTCDQMRRLSGTVPTARVSICLHVPATWQTPEARDYYRAELKRLGRFLERLDGRPPDDTGLAGQMDRFTAARDRLIRWRGHLGSRAHAELTHRFFGAGQMPPEPPAARGGAAAGPGIPLLLVGSPFRETDLPILDLVDRAGGWIASDATDTGEREWPASVDRPRRREAPFDALVHAYFDTIPAVFRRPNTALFEWLRHRVKCPPAIRGIVCATHPWCDLWRAELPRLREALPLPFLHLDLGGSTAPTHVHATRIEAFMELIA